jgi:hypothetical protein
MLGRLVLTAAIGTAMAFAQGGMGGGGMGGGGSSRNGGGMGGGEMGGGGMRTPRQSPFDQFAEKLKLSKDQKTEAQTVVQDALKEMTPILQQLQQARQNLAGAFIDGQSGDPVLKAYAPLAAQTAGIEAQAFAKIYKMLKPNQQKNAPQAFEMLADMLDRPRTAGRSGNRSDR